MGSMPKRHACCSGSAAKALPVLAASASSACVAVGLIPHATAGRNISIWRMLLDNASSQEAKFALLVTVR
jgi:hypothetical protein